MQSILIQAVWALQQEIETIKKKPSKEVIRAGKIVRQMDHKEFWVEFEHPIQNLKFVEECKAYCGDQTLTVTPVEITEQKMLLKFPKIPEDGFENIELEWENDFVLKRTKERIEELLESSEVGLLKDLVAGRFTTKHHETETEVYHDGSRNTAQEQSLSKALNQKISFIWGPPGTGKTSTIGYIVANFLLHDKKVLLVSNTNRAVDVALNGVLEALHSLQVDPKPYLLTRFGDLALDKPELINVSFEKQIEQKLLEKQKRLNKWIQLLQQLSEMESAVENLLSKGDTVPDSLEAQLIFLQNEIEKNGGIESLKQRIELGSTVHERFELQKYQCVATTLAKVCTSDLLDSLQFDAVVIDEASMANLPYVFVMASKARSHLVIGGDPVQLPPISIAEDAEAQKFLEKDIFSFTSGAETINDLFSWHDTLPEATSFFDTQYRMNEDIAGIISSTFYEGRLKTADKPTESSKISRISFSVIDSSAENSEIVKKGEQGFQPFNAVHIRLATGLIRDLLDKEYQQSEIGLIVPFRSAVWRYRQQLRNSGFTEIEVGTIHTFQGREKKVILFDTVMSGEKSSSGFRHYSVRPFDEAKSGLQVPRLLNVAFSRSKEHFYVIADLNHIRRVYQNKFLGKLINRMIELGKEG